MWHREYKDYKIDEALIQEVVEPSQGIYGCEMHEINGWGNTLQRPIQKKRRGVIASLVTYFFGISKEEVP